MKKTMKTVLALVLALSMLVCFAAPAFAATDLSTPSKINLQFNEEGKFRILQFADTQDNIFLRPGTIRLMKDAIAKFKPDLVVFTGDNTGAVDTKFGCKYALKALLTVCEDAKVPFTCVFGNHDAENVAKEYHLECWRSYSYCMAYDDPGPNGEDLYGCANHNLTVKSSDGKKTAFNLWMIDSNMYDEENGGYDYIHPDQLAWYKAKSDALKEANGGELVPSLCFQHIVPNEIMDYTMVGENDSIGYDDNGKHIVLNPDACEPGSILLEHPCPGTVNGGQLQAFQDQGDVLGVVVGHDHVNSYIVHTDFKTAQDTPIDIIQTAGAGFCSYGDERVRGCRVIDLDESDPWNYETQAYTFFDVCGVSNETLQLSYFSKTGYAYWIVSMVIECLPFVGPQLAQIFRDAVYSAANK